MGNIAGVHLLCYHCLSFSTQHPKEHNSGKQALPEEVIQGKSHRLVWRKRLWLHKLKTLKVRRQWVGAAGKGQDSAALAALLEDSSSFSSARSQLPVIIVSADPMASSGCAGTKHLGGTSETLQENG